METWTITDFPSELYKQLTERAQEHRRSLSSEAIILLEQAMHQLRPDEDDLMQRIRELRAAFPTYLSEADRQRARDEGRERR